MSRLATLAAGEALVPLTSGILSDGPWCPDAASTYRFDADLFRVRRIDALVRVQASMPRFRGMNPLLFANPGTAQAPLWLVPDQEVQDLGNAAESARRQRAMRELVTGLWVRSANEQGSALILAMAAGVLLAALGSALVRISALPCSFALLTHRPVTSSLIAR